MPKFNSIYLAWTLGQLAVVAPQISLHEFGDAKSRVPSTARVMLHPKPPESPPFKAHPQIIYGSVKLKDTLMYSKIL